MSWAAQAQRPRGPSCALTLLTYCRGRERRHGQGKQAGLNLSVPRADRTRCILRRLARTAFHAKLTVFYVNTYCTPASNSLHLRQNVSTRTALQRNEGGPLRPPRKVCSPSSCSDAPDGFKGVVNPSATVETANKTEYTSSPGSPPTPLNVSHLDLNTPSWASGCNGP
jgi:hypothetical protein